MSDKELQSIDLDCPPGCPRPNDLIAEVLKGTGLEPYEVATIFGAAQWEFDVEREDWINRIQPIIQPRIENLYHQGVIRYGSW